MSLVEQGFRKCPFCDSDKLIYDASACAEIAGECYQTCWVECDTCGSCGPLVYSIEGKVGELCAMEATKQAWNGDKNDY